MTDDATSETPEGWWDEPWYRVRTDRFVASFLPSAGEDLDAVCNVNIEVQLTDGSRWSPTVLTVNEVQRYPIRGSACFQNGSPLRELCRNVVPVRTMQPQILSSLP